MRNHRFSNLESEPLDVFIIGGGISGAPVYNALARAGYRVGLVDRGDFASGTSQSSGMLIWGGLLYLRHFDLRTVRNLCLARNRHLAQPGLHPLQFRYRTAHAGGLPRSLLQLGLYAYWLLGNCALKRPELLNRGTAEEAVAFEEAMLNESDSRMVLRYLALASDHAIALNYCEVTAARYEVDEKSWSIDLCDRLTGKMQRIKSRFIVNACGIYADSVNEKLGIDSPYRHLLSKGVYINLQRTDARTYAEIFPMPGASDVLTSVPWGPVMMWGPTETPISPNADLASGQHPDRDDLRFLLESAGKFQKRSIPMEEIVSLRCGIRPLTISRGTRQKGYSLAISRRHYLAENACSIVIYGGKLTASDELGTQVLERMARRFPARYAPPSPSSPSPARIYHPAFDHPIVSPQWARSHEQCHTLADYLRRRTPVSQWVHRMGLGRQGEYRALLEEWAGVFTSSQPGEAQARDSLIDYESDVHQTYDTLLQS